MLLLAGLVVTLHFRVLAGLGRDWLFEDSVHHGPVALALAGWLIWRSRGELSTLAKPSLPAGLGVTCVSVLMLLTGSFSGDFLVMRLAWWLSTVGVLITIVGWAVAWRLRFALFVLLWTIRVPQLVFFAIVVPLRNATEWLATFVLRNAAGVAVYHDGESLELAGAHIDGAEVFFSVRLIFSVVFLAMAYAYLASRSWKFRAWFPLVVAGVFIAFAAAYGGMLLWLYDHDIKQAVDWTRRFFQWIPAVAALGVAVGGHRWWLRRGSRDGGEREFPTLPRALEASQGYSGNARPVYACAGFLVIAIGLVNLYPGIRDVAPQQALATLPSAIDGWSAVRDEPLAAEELELLQADEVLNRYYQGPRPGASVNLTSAYYRSQRSKASPHSPKVCLIGAGWNPVEEGRVTIHPSQATAVEVNRFVLAKDDRRVLLLYWFVSEQHVFLNEYAAKLDTLWRSLVRHRNDTAFVRVIVPLQREQPVGEAEATAVEFANAAYERVMQLFPR